MAANDLSLGDWRRLLVGEAPFTFLAEVLVRTLIVFVFLTFVMRAMGKRMGGQISNLELAVMLSLGAIVSVPMQVAERGVLPAGVLLLCLLGLQRAMTVFGARWPRLERLTQGRPSILVRDGLLSLPGLRGARISQRQLFSTLRSKGVRHLGQVKRVYLEAGGVISILRAHPVRPGLLVLPAGDGALREGMPAYRGYAACVRCGAVCPEGTPRCPRCRHHRWGLAVAGDEA